MSLFAKKHTLLELAELTDSKLLGNPEHIITGVEALELATPTEASFLANLRYKEVMQHSKAGVICIGTDVPVSDDKNYLVSENPSKTFQKIAEIFLSHPYNTTGFVGIHPTSVIHPSAILGNNVSIGPYTVIDQGVQIGENTSIASSVSIGPGVMIGKNCIFYSHVTIRERCEIGDRVILQPGVVIGSCGFGYTTDANGFHHKLDQLGIVSIEDDVEIGANTTIDRARFSKTIIGKGTKIDNLVQIGHNVRIGPHNIIISQTGVAGSVKTGRNVVMGGQSGVVGHIEIADFVMIATRGGISKSMPEAGKFAGSPVMPLPDYNRQQVHLRKISEYVRELDALKKQVEELKVKQPELSDLNN